jgi:hypothetical protein
MKPIITDFLPLLSDEVFMAGISSSDARSLWRSLARTEAVRSVSRQLASDPDTIRRLCAFMRELLEAPADAGYMHPHDMAICGGLVLLEQSPLSVVRNLFARLRELRQPSLFWVQQMAAYCDQRFADVMRQRFTLHLPQDASANRLNPRLDTVVWANAATARRRYSLQPA